MDKRFYVGKWKWFFVKTGRSTTRLTWDFGLELMLKPELMITIKFMRYRIRWWKRG